MFFSRILDFIYPPICIHCGEVVRGKDSLLCNLCGSFLELLDPKDQCPFCFAHSHTKSKRCLIKDSVIYRAAAALEYGGPASSLVKQLKYDRQNYISKGLAAFLVSQYLRLNWPKPDVVIPVPQAFLQSMIRGYNHSYLIAKDFAHMIQAPVFQSLKRRFGAIPQASLPKDQRQKLNSSCFFVKGELLDKTVLIIDDVMTTRATLIACAEALQEAYPAKIYALTVCC